MNLRTNYNNLRTKEYCEKCSEILQLEYHRINPDGPYEDWNVQVLCDSCHKKIHTKIPRRMFKIPNRGKNYFERTK